MAGQWPHAASFVSYGAEQRPRGEHLAGAAAPAAHSIMSEGPGQKVLFSGQSRKHFFQPHSWPDSCGTSQS
jgi:hypothetical protein